ncbi:5064_t:CDS:2, partial [Racocetra fulgida]
MSIDPQNPGYIVCYDPATGQLLSNIRAHTEQDVVEALKKARNAQKKWAQTTFKERRKVLKIKSSEQVAWSLQYYSEIVKTCLISCGHDPDIVQFLCGFADCGEALVKSGVDGITLIGSPQVGRQVMSSSSTTLTPCTLELGGKDCAILRQDVNLRQIIPVILRGVFQNAGQNCIGLERILVHESIYDKFVKIIELRVRELRVGCALNDEEVSQGAKLLYGGHPFVHPLYPTAHYYTPTLLIDVTPDMPISQTEHFGPIMVVMKFRTDDEAIEIANSSGYGLGNSVFTKDQRKGEWMARRLRSGMVNINDFGASYLCNLPFGGVEGLRQQCLMKSITLDRFPWLIQTSIPKMLDYPVHFCGPMFVSNLVKTVYENRLLDKVKGIIKLIVKERIDYEE